MLKRYTLVFLLDRSIGVLHKLTKQVLINLHEFTLFQANGEIVVSISHERDTHRLKHNQYLNRIYVNPLSISIRIK